MSSSDNFLRIVVFPELSNPRTRIRASESLYIIEKVAKGRERRGKMRIDKQM
jgi:hypothetical protein